MEKVSWGTWRGGDSSHAEDLSSLAVKLEISRRRRVGRILTAGFLNCSKRRNREANNCNDLPVAAADHLCPFPPVTGSSCPFWPQAGVGSRIRQTGHNPPPWCATVHAAEAAVVAEVQPDNAEMQLNSSHHCFVNDTTHCSPN